MNDKTNGYKSLNQHVIMEICYRTGKKCRKGCAAYAKDALIISVPQENRSRMRNITETHCADLYIQSIIAENMSKIASNLEKKLRL
jgi:hypothetical protein